MEMTPFCAARKYKLQDTTIGLVSQSAFRSARAKRREILRSPVATGGARSDPANKTDPRDTRSHSAIDFTSSHISDT